MGDRVVYFHDLPFDIAISICCLLDSSGAWRELEYFVTNDKNTGALVKDAIQHDRSPTCVLLNKYAERRGTVTELFVILVRLGQEEALTLIKKYVDVEYILRQFEAMH